MNNLTQIKSGQLETIIKKQIINKTTSIQHFEEDSRIQYRPRFKRSPNYQDHYQMSSLVKQILQIKPKTAQKIKENYTRNQRTEIISECKPKIQFFPNNYKQNQLNCSNSNDNVEENQYKNSLSKQKRYEKSTEKKPIKLMQSKSSRGLKHEINLTDAIYSYKNLDQHKKNQDSTINKAKSVSKTNDNECKIRITKRKTQFSIPKPKITIKNIDQLVYVESKNLIGRSKQFPLYDLNLPRHNINFRQAKEDMKQQKQKKQKKSLIDNRIPQFIKASLQIYQKEPNFLIEQLQKRKKRQSHVEKDIIEQQITVEPLKDQIQPLVMNQAQIIETENVFINKIRLINNNKKSFQQIEPHNESIQAEPVIQQIAQKKVGKSKKRKQLEQQIHICGWQQQNGPKTVYFQF